MTQGTKEPSESSALLSLGLWPDAVGLAAMAIAGCASAPEESGPVGGAQHAIIYDADDRQEYFEVSPGRQVLALSEVALMNAASAASLRDGRFAELPMQKIDTQCENRPVRFAEQPGAAFCSGTLVDWDLVLTAGHCALLPLRAMRVVFGYYYRDESRKLARGGLSVVEVSDVLASADPSTDYAWLRLAHDVEPPWRPAAVFTRESSARLASNVTVVSTPMGVPLKWDAGGDLRWTDPLSGYFEVSSDTFVGSSGGGAFAADGGLLGVLSRGSADFRKGPEGCWEVVSLSSTAATNAETYALATSALAALCEVWQSDLCDPACKQPCRVAARAVGPESGCAVHQSLLPHGSPGPLLMFGIGVLLRWVSGRRR